MNFFMKDITVALACLKMQCSPPHKDVQMVPSQPLACVPSSRTKCQITTEYLSCTRGGRWNGGTGCQRERRGGRTETKRPVRERDGGLICGETEAAGIIWRAEKSKKREAIRKLKGLGVESGYLEPDWKHSVVSIQAQAPSMEELTEEKEEAAAVNSLFRWSLAKRDWTWKVQDISSVLFGRRWQFFLFFGD